MVRIRSLYGPYMLIVTFIWRLIPVLPHTQPVLSSLARSHPALTFSGSAGKVRVFDICLPNNGSIAEDIVKYQVVTLEVPFIILTTSNPKPGYYPAYEWKKRKADVACQGLRGHAHRDRSSLHSETIPSFSDRI